MATTVTTSLVVQFDAAEGSDSILDAEVDSREDGMNSGRTSFAAGDSVGYLIYKTSDVLLQTQVTSAGSLISKGTELIDVEEFLVFANVREVKLPYPVYSNFVATWYGTNLGGVTVVNEAVATIATEGVGVAKVTYKTLANKWQLNSPSVINGESTFQIVVYIPGVVG